MFWPLAAKRNWVAASRTCPTLPGADWNLLDHTVWIESTTTSAGLSRATSSRMRSRHVSASRYSGAVADAQPLAAALHLVLGFLARGVEHRADGAGEVRRRLQQQRGLADAGLAAEQHERARHDAAAEHAVELVDAGRQPHGLRRFDVGVQRRACSTRRAARSGARAPGAASTARSSTSVFQPPHSAQRPIHFGACAPHSWHTKTTFGAFISNTPLGTPRLSDAARPACPAGTRSPTESSRSTAAISRASICCHALVALPADDHHLVAGLHVAEPGDVDGHHVHRHRARRSARDGRARAPSRGPPAVCRDRRRSPRAPPRSPRRRRRWNRQP